MSELRIVFSNQPLAYREAIAAAVGSLRPEIVVSCSDPGDLDAEIMRVDPHLVVGSEIAESLRARLSSWIML
jgi:hypothetical protein